MELWPFDGGFKGYLASGYAKFVEGAFMLASKFCVFCPWYAGQRVSVSNEVLINVGFMPVIYVVEHEND